MTLMLFTKDYPHIFNEDAKQFTLSKSNLGMYSSISNSDDRVDYDYEKETKQQNPHTINENNTVTLKKTFYIYEYSQIRVL